MKSLCAIYAPSLNIGYVIEGPVPPELSNVPLWQALEIRDRSQEYEDHSEYYFEVIGTTFDRVLIDVPVILFNRDFEETKPNEASH